MTSILPPIPRFVFTILEPLSLIAGAVAPFISPEWFVAEQTPMSPLEPISANTRVVAYQLGNIYLLLAMVGVAVLYSTTEPKVVRNYVIALWIADIGHVGITCFGMDYNRLIDLPNWNPMTWGNIGATVLLFLTRTAYLLGLFGQDRQVVPVSKKVQ
ncbi:hypothetical protein LAWI1_G000508 [Lachnellula willkommii]|uniref:DUF7704 domain-containing protein n=1 Tax=Lachnellula willkommii TaxID=215461 RepID=A0A559MGT3_9HELO|nr:hypothetical protein LAWI1_G000508 [Lachnellula willkommii]